MIISAADRLTGVKAYYFAQKLEDIRGMIAEGKDVINFGIGSPDLPPDESVIQELSDSAKGHSNHGYQAYKGIPELREEMANWYKSTYNVQLDAKDNILPMMGSKEGILHVTLAFVNPGDEVLVPNPGYPTYTSLTRLLGGKTCYYDLKESNNWYPDFDEIEKQDLSKVKIMWLNYPHMPTGAPARKDVFEQYIAFAKKHKILLCHDNPYSLVLNKQRPISILSLKGADEVAIEFNSFSKSHNMAGWRVGMFLGKKEYVDLALRVKSNIDSGMFKGIQEASIKALQLDNAWHQERNAIYAIRREWCYKILDLLGFEYNTSQEGLFVWAKPKADNAIQDIPAFIDKILAERHVFFTPGMIFGSNGEGFIRLSLCVPEDRMKKAYDRLNVTLQY